MAVRDKVTLPALQQMKREGQRSVCIVAWDYHMARIADRAGVEIVSVGDTVGTNLWGQRNPLEVTMDQMVTVCQAVRRGVDRALLSCDFPYGPLQEGPASAVSAAIRLVKQAGIDVVKLDGAADYPDAVEAVVRAGIPVFAQFGITPQTAMHYGLEYSSMSKSGAEVPGEMTDRLVGEARRLEAAGASLLNFTNSGPTVGPEVVRAVEIPVLGGFGGGPWLDGRIRMAHSAVGYPSSMLDEPVDTYANVARISFDAITALSEDIRAGRQIKSGRPTSS